MAAFTDPAVTVPTTVEECDAQLDDLRLILAGVLTPKRRRFVWRIVNRVLDIRSDLASA